MIGPVLVIIALAALVLLAFGVDGAIRPHAEDATICDEPWCALGADDRVGHREAGGCVARDLGAEYDRWRAEHLEPLPPGYYFAPSGGEQAVTYPIFDTLADAQAAEAAPWSDPT